jgi:hydrogenase maturation protease
MNGYDTLILVDAVRRGGAPGTVYVIEPEPGGTVSGPGPLDGHDMTPETVLRALESLAGAQGDDPGDGLSGGRGGGPGRVLVVGCEAADVGEGIGLSPPVARAVDEAVALVRGLLEELRHGTVGHGTRGGAGC